MQLRATAMGCLGVHFALTEAEVGHLLSIEDAQERLDYLIDELEEKYFTDFEVYLAESDKAWDAMHRALTDGELAWDNGEYPLNHVVLGGELLYSGSDYIVSLKSPDQVRDIAAALPMVTEEGFRRGYYAIDPASYDHEITDEDFRYTWDWIQNVRRIYLKAASEGRYVLFTADQ
jgi:hypothetical protein